ncbi:7TM-DISM domain-containing protein, partial [Acinetobacter baumannii]
MAGALHLTNFSLVRMTDPGRQADITAVAGGALPGVTASSRFFLPAVAAAHWFAFTLRNVSAEPAALVIRLDEAYLHTVDLMVREGDHWQVDRSGL